VAKSKLKLELERAAVAGTRFGMAKGKLSKEMEKSISELGKATLRVYKFWTPRKTGRMQKGLRASKSGKGQIDISITAVADSGFSYVAVTRFGHKVATISPNTASILKLNMYGGFWTFAPTVKGYRPDFDWAEEAHLTAQKVAEQHAKALSTRLELRLMS
jgi:hypothetical protein